MFCTGCGHEVLPGQKFCGYCGRPAEPVAQRAPQAVPSSLRDALPPRLQTGAAGLLSSKLRLLAGLWMAFAVLLVLSGFYSTMMFNTLTQMGNMRIGSLGGMMWARYGANIWTFTMVRVVIAAVPAFGLHTRQKWARWVTIIACVPALFFLKPFGAVLAVYSVYSLLRGGAAQELRQLG